MRLGDVLNKIFRKRKSEEIVGRNKMPAEDIYKPIEHQVSDDSRFKKISEHINTEQGTQHSTEMERLKKKKSFIVVGAGIAAILIIVALLGVMYVRIVNSAFGEDKVSIFINGKERITVGEEVEYEITVENKNRVKLNNVTIGLNFPSNFELKEEAFIIDKNLSGARINVGEIKSKSKKKYKIKILASHSNNATFSLKVSAKYEPNNVSSFFQTSTSKNVVLEHSGIDTAIFSVDSASGGELVDLIITVKNNGQKEYDKLIFEMEYPKGFDFSNSTVEAINEAHNKWVFEKLQPAEKREIKISGKLTGKVGAIKRFKGIVIKNTDEHSVVSSGEKNIRIIPSKVILKQESSSDNTYPGKFVDYTIFFKNNSAVNLRNLILKVHLPGKFIKRDSVKHEEGYYDSRENVLTWKAADIEKLQNLQPDEEGSVDFSVQIQEQILPENNKNPYLRVYSEIESLDVDSPIFENKKIISQQIKTVINSLINVGSIITYMPEDNNGVEEGDLKVDKKTFLRVNLSMKNTTSDLKNTKLIASLPTGVSWEKQIYPEGNNLEFNDRSNEMEWKIGAVKAGTGFETPAEKAEFVISVTPSVNQVGQTINLISDMQINAEDIFTNNNIEYKFKVIKSDVIKGMEDLAVSP